MATLREIRKAAGKSLEWVAVQASVSSPTVRLFELVPTAVCSAPKRIALEAVYASLAATLASTPAGEGSRP